MAQFFSDTTGAFHGVAQVRDLYVDNNGPTDWYVAVRMGDGALFAVLDGFADQPSANAAAREVADAFGYVNVADLV